MNILIKNYINRITKEDIKKFSIKNNIVLNDIELNIIYKVIKEEYELLLENYECIFLKYKDLFNQDNYNKIYELFTIYRKRYKSYL